jgi:hypothetical protein
MAGQVKVDIDTLTLADNWPQEIVAVVRVESLSSTLIAPGRDGLLGNAIAEFDSAQETEDGVVTGIIRDEGGPLGLDGKLILTQPNTYSLSVLVKDNAEASDMLRQNLLFLGSANADGARLFELSGNF